MPQRARGPHRGAAPPTRASRTATDGPRAPARRQSRARREVRAPTGVMADATHLVSTDSWADDPLTWFVVRAGKRAACPLRADCASRRRSHPPPKPVSSTRAGPDAQPSLAGPVSLGVSTRFSHSRGLYARRHSAFTNCRARLRTGVLAVARRRSRDKSGLLVSCFGGLEAVCERVSPAGMDPSGTGHG